MFDQDKWKETRNNIYSRLHSGLQKGVVTEIKPSANFINGEVGLWAGFRFSEEDVSRIHAFSRGASEITPMAVYGEEQKDPLSNPHSSLMYDVPGDLPLNGSSMGQHKERMENLATRVEALAEAITLPRPVITFDRFGFNDNSLIALGNGDDAYTFIAQALSQIDEGIPYWGAHMTTGRFVQPENGDVAEEMRQYVEKSQPFGELAPVALDIGIHYMMAEPKPLVYIEPITRVLYK